MGTIATNNKNLDDTPKIMTTNSKPSPYTKVSKTIEDFKDKMFRKFDLNLIM